MKDSGNMKVYYLTRDVYEGALGFSHGFAMKQKVIYIPKPYGVAIAQNPQNKDEFYYIKEKGIINNMEDIVKGKSEGKAAKIDMDVNDVTALLDLGTAKERADSNFNRKAKSLFDIVAKEAPKGVKGCCS